MEKQNNKLILGVSIVLFAVVLLVFILTLSTYYPYWFGVEKRTFYASVNVTKDRGGFDLNISALTFGKIASGGSASRDISFWNGYGFPVILEISSSGSIKNILSYDNDILASANETKRIGFSVSASNETKIGFYEGYVTIKVVPAV